MPRSWLALNHLRDIGQLLNDAYKAWTEDKAMRLSAAVAMYSVLSISPLLIITIKFVATVASEEVATVQTDRQVRSLLGPTGANAVHKMIGHTAKPGSGVIAATVSSILLVVTASAVFAELQDALNTVWRVKAIPRQGWNSWLKNRLESMAMVFVVGFLLLISQLITTMLTVVSEKIAHEEGSLSIAIDTMMSLTLITVLFAMIFRFLPDVRIGWRDVMLGALVTALLFKFGQFLLALYFKYGTPSSPYGAAGSFVAVLLWVYYSCWILFYGAEFTKVYAHYRGRWVVTEGYATPLTSDDRKEQGLKKSDTVYVHDGKDGTT